MLKGSTNTTIMAAFCELKFNIFKKQSTHTLVLCEYVDQTNVCLHTYEHGNRHKRQEFCVTEVVTDTGTTESLAVQNFILEQVSNENDC